jgi:hypothetical protein
MHKRGGRLFPLRGCQRNQMNAGERRLSVILSRRPARLRLHRDVNPETFLDFEPFRATTNPQMHSRAQIAPGQDMFHKTTRILRDAVHSTQFVACDKGLIVFCFGSRHECCGGGASAEARDLGMSGICVSIQQAGDSACGGGGNLVQIKRYEAAESRASRWRRATERVFSAVARRTRRHRKMGHPRCIMHLYRAQNTSLQAEFDLEAKNALHTTNAPLAHHIIQSSQVEDGRDAYGTLGLNSGWTYSALRTGKAHGGGGHASTGIR